MTALPPGVLSRSPWPTTKRTPAACWTTTPGPTSAAARPTKSPCAPTAAPGTAMPCGRACCAAGGRPHPGQPAGRTLAHPILLAPVAFQRLAHPDGELASAYAAAAQGAGLVLSTQASTAAGSRGRPCCDDPGRGPLWFQLYLQHDRGFTRELVQRAEAAGYEALVLTVDAPTSGARDRERRAGLSPAARHGRRQPGRAAAAPRSPAAAPAKARCSTACCTRPHLGRHRLAAGHHPPARCCSRACCTRTTRARPPAAGRGGPDRLQPRRAHARHRPATADALPRMVQAVGGALPVLVDGGIRRGTDVLKAMALGASAVLVGRPYVYGPGQCGRPGRRPCAAPAARRTGNRHGAHRLRHAGRCISRRC
jgi:4-hydroxymandelate oxidase